MLRMVISTTPKSFRKFYFFSENGWNVNTNTWRKWKSKKWKHQDHVQSSFFYLNIPYLYYYSTDAFLQILGETCALMNMK